MLKLSELSNKYGAKESAVARTTLNAFMHFNIFNENEMANSIQEPSRINVVARRRYNICLGVYLKYVLDLRVG